MNLAVHSLILKYLPRLRRWQHVPGIGLLCRLLTDLYERAEEPIPTKLHGFDVVLNAGNTYPFILHHFPLFNAPLVELVYQASRSLPKQLVLVDVGAAIGDTVLLLKERCCDLVGRYYCVEGDDEFFQLLNANMKQFSNVVPIMAVLASKPTEIGTLVKHHRGTAAAIGRERVQARRLDSLPELINEHVDILKIDVDGFDGEVLAGATNILERSQPAVIFEWHPKLIEWTGNDALRAFSVLRENGYTRFLWFDNVGTFSHFSEGGSPSILMKENEYLLVVNYRADEHFDVIALPELSPIPEVELATLEYARKRASLLSRGRMA